MSSPMHRESMRILIAPYSHPPSARIPGKHALPHRHRPGHHQQRPGLHRPADKPGTGSPTIQPSPSRNWSPPGEVARRGRCCRRFSICPGRTTCRPARPPCPGTRHADYAVGEFARNHGAQVPGRLVTSAKSWLCHAGVDRTAPLLPWSAPPDVPRISPVEASDALSAAPGRGLEPRADGAGRAEDRLEKQTVVLTVPASFDDVARNLTVEAASKAGLENLTLLEEPQAAFYCWLATHSAEEAGQLKPGDALPGRRRRRRHHRLQPDPGRRGARANWTSSAQAVGDHLLLGGDNMDLALAKFVETQAARGRQARRGPVRHADAGCRQAKEALLGPKPPAESSGHGHGPRPVGHRRHAARRS